MLRSLLIILFLTQIFACGSGSDGTNGTNGTNGDIGSQGPPGKDGTSAQTIAANPYDIVDIIDPCGDAPLIYDELIFKLRNGSYLFSFSDAGSNNNTRLTILPPGDYETTDGSFCLYSVHTDGSISWQ